MEIDASDILADVSTYYTAKLVANGPTPRGVDWNGEEGQRIRFTQLTKIVDQLDPFSIIDLGCGYGALYDYLAGRFDNFSYLGIDISQAMIDAAAGRIGNRRNVKLEVGDRPACTADFAVASGVFNVLSKRNQSKWRSYLEATLEMLDQSSHKAFAFNCLTTYSDADKMRPHLYYADPCELFALCKRRFSKNVALLHDYGLYEFTILVRKSS